MAGVIIEPSPSGGGTGSAEISYISTHPVAGCATYGEHHIGSADYSLAPRLISVGLDVPDLFDELNQVADRADRL